MTNIQLIHMTNDHKNNEFKPNKFVLYLNSMQRTGGSNINSLAEAQACNPNFAHIFVSHPLTSIIHDKLTSQEKNHIILTGHAGDGKTTIALEVFKKLYNIDASKPLHKHLEPREDITNCNVTILKDLSERNKTEDSNLIRELSLYNRKFLIVSNTGTLLDLLKKQHNLLALGADEIESHVLTAISDTSATSKLTLGDLSFDIYNLSQVDNLNLSKQVFSKIIAKERWEHCLKRECSKYCPIYKNIQLLQNHNLVIDRIFLTYRRIYEYGDKLTMRQLTEHFAYFITAGLNFNSLEELKSISETKIFTQHLFFNIFFGDNGETSIPEAAEIKAIKLIKEQNFGTRHSPQWERKVWFHKEKQKLPFSVPSTLESISERLYRQGISNTNEFSSKARAQIRRIIYFFQDFDEKNQNFISYYLNSINLLNWYKWQNVEYKLNLIDKNYYDEKIFHVLLEHYTGVKLPETNTTYKRLYITLNRNKSEIKQTAQIVLSDLNWSDSFELELTSTQNTMTDQRKDLVLTGKNGMRELRLTLTLPFLDYVIMRHYGEVGEILQKAFLDRLERFKAQILNKTNKSENSVILIRLKTDNSFIGQKLSVNKGKLEVTDA